MQEATLAVSPHAAAALLLQGPQPGVSRDGNPALAAAQPEFGKLLKNIAITDDLPASGDATALAAGLQPGQDALALSAGSRAAQSAPVATGDWRPLAASDAGLSGNPSPPGGNPLPLASQAGQSRDAAWLTGSTLPVTPVLQPVESSPDRAAQPGATSVPGAGAGAADAATGRQAGAETEGLPGREIPRPTEHTARTMQDTLLASTSVAAWEAADARGPRAFRLASLVSGGGDFMAPAPSPTTAVAPPLPGTAASPLADTAPAQASGLPLLTDTDQPDESWSRQLGQNLLMLATRGETSARLKLNPEHLGMVEVDIRLEDDKALLRFASAQPMVREALEAALPRLRELFAEQGMQLVRAEVGEDAGGDAMNHARDERQQRQHGQESAALFAPPAETPAPGSGASISLLGLFQQAGPPRLLDVLA